MISIRTKLILFMCLLIMIIDALSCLFLFVHVKREQEDAFKKLGMSIVTILAEDNEVKLALSHAQPAFLDAPIKRIMTFDRNDERGYWRISSSQEVIVEEKASWLNIDIKEIPVVKEFKNTDVPYTKRRWTSGGINALEPSQNPDLILINRMISEGNEFYDFSVPVYERQIFSEEAFATEILNEDKIAAEAKQRMLGYVQIGLSTHKLNKKIHDFVLHNILPMSLSIILGGLCIAFFLTRYIVLPLRRMASITLDIARGNLTHTIAVRSKDEIGQLSANFNQMTKSLEKSYTELKQEVAEHKQTEKLLQYRVKIEELVAGISANFINLAPHEVDAGINRALKAIGEFTNVDRSYVFLYSDNEKKNMDNTHEWCAEGIAPQIENLKGLPVDNFPWALKELLQFESIHVPRVADMPDIALAEKELQESQGVQSFVIVPMIYGGSLCGFLGLDSVRVEKTWTEEDIAMLKMVGEIFVNTLERKRAEERVKHHVKRLTTLHTIDKAIIGSLDLQVILRVLLEQVTTQLGVDAANVLLLNRHTRKLECAATLGFRSNAAISLYVCLKENYARRTMLERRIVYISNLSETDAPCVKLLEGEEFVVYYGIPLIAKGEVKGVLEIFNRTHLNPDQGWFGFLETMGAMAAMAIDNTSLFEGTQRSHAELTLAYDTTIEGWSRALDMRNKETKEHSHRVTEMTLKLAPALGIKEDELVHIRRGALLHDIGKMGIPDTILLKPGKLTEEEWQIMRMHPVYAYQLLSPIIYLHKALDIPYCHHENWDGSGYPKGLSGEQIPLAARIFSVVDVWDALLSDRPYRSALTEDKTIEHIQLNTGKQFDPTIVKTFFRIYQ